MIDLRSDTVTRPTAAMREAMVSAEVGDDVYGEDPTINALEAAAAERMGKAAAMLVPSGTMANLAALLTHCSAGDEVLLGDQAHIVRAEVGGAARLGGLLLSALPNLADGGIDPDRIRSAVRGANLHHPPTTLLALENTHNFCGGKVLSLESTRILTEVAQELELQTHMDGARIFNAQAASGVSAAQLVETVDSVSFCLSKGLSAPVGSLLCGSESFIARARKMRKMLGGGMRQAGIVAAAGLVALDEMVDRLADDHANAKRLAEGLAGLGYEVRPADVESNIIVIPVEDSAAFQRQLAASGVLATVLSDRLGRLVTHSDVTTADIDEALNRIEQAHAVPA
jgi:threonine aldolase